MREEDFLEKFKDTIYFFPNSVHILATDGRAGKRAITVSSVVPFSYSPPSMLVCIQKTREFNKRFLENKVFTINSLSAANEELAKIFGGQTEEDRYKYLLKSNLTTGAPIIDNAYLIFDCVLDEFYEHFTHYILIAKVVDASRHNTISRQQLLMCTQKSFKPL